MDFNPGKRFLLKAETIEVIEGFENCLLSYSSSSTFERCGDVDCDVRSHVDIENNNNDNNNNIDMIEVGFQDLNLKTENDREVSDEEIVKEKNEKIVKEKIEKIGVEKESDSKKVKKSFNIIVSHGDCVCCLPPNTLLLGSSISCTNEMYVTGVYGNIFACQSHPEFHFDYAIKDRIWKSVVELNKKLNKEELKIANETFSIYNRKDSDELLLLIQRFLSVDNCNINI